MSQSSSETTAPPSGKLGRRPLLLGVAAVGVGLAGYRFATRRSAAVGGEQLLRVGRTGKGSYDSVLVAAGVTTPGVRVVYSDFQSGHLQVEALNGASLDFGSMSEIPPVFAAASSIQSFRQIATIQSDVNNQVVLVPRGSTIQSLADLKGKKVGYVRATTAQYFLIRMLESVGLGWSD
ncbi:MAG: ABC transporter substrate-binding protein, partial [Polyangiales bacterium]